MFISRLALRNWRNFKHVDAQVGERVFLIGPNAAGKSNLLDALRFLRDVAKRTGGGLQQAVESRGGWSKLHSLSARRDSSVMIEVELSEHIDEAPAWRYRLAFKSEDTGAQRVIVDEETVVRLTGRGKTLLSRPDKKDDKDIERLTETSLEHANSNKDFREIAQFFSALTCLNPVPQLLRYAELGAAGRLAGDPFGQSLLERIAKTADRMRNVRLKKIETALRVCVPNLRNLKFLRDPVTGTPHLKALYEHWRPDAGWQREDQFSDGTLRLLSLMWSLLDGDSLLLLEEPELSLSESIVRQIPPLIGEFQRKAKCRRQVFIATHSKALLEHKSIDPREVLLLQPSSDGTTVQPPSEEDIKLVEGGYTVAEAIASRSAPARLDQFSLP